MTDHFLADTAVEAIARGEPVRGIALYGVRAERDGEVVIGIAANPELWLHIADALYLVGHADAPNAAIYRGLNEAICSYFGIGRVE
jgi:hypothetical protein